MVTQLGSGTVSYILCALDSVKQFFRRGPGLQRMLSSDPEYNIGPDRRLTASLQAPFKGLVGDNNARAQYTKALLEVTKEPSNMPHSI
jgi:hypothetical protein